MEITLIRKIFRPFLNWFWKSGSIPFVLRGTEYGAWPFPNALVGKDVEILTIGVGEDLSFEISVNAICTLNLLCFDPTIKAANYAKKVTPEFGKIKFINKAVVSDISKANFASPSNPDHVSMRMVEQKEGNANINMTSVELLTQDFPCNKFDIIKMDIEGFEITVLNTLLDFKIHPKYFLVEFHHNIYSNCSVLDTHRLIRRLKSLNYECFFVSKTGSEYGFVKKCVDS